MNTSTPTAKHLLSTEWLNVRNSLKGLQNEFFASLDSLVPTDAPEIAQEQPVLAQPQLIGEIEDYIRQLNAELRAFITKYDHLTNEEENAIDSDTIFYLPSNEVQEVLVQVHDVGPAKPTSIFDMVEIDDEELDQIIANL